MQLAIRLSSSQYRSHVRTEPISKCMLGQKLLGLEVLLALVCTESLCIDKPDDSSPGKLATFSIELLGHFHSATPHRPLLTSTNSVKANDAISV